MRVKTVLRGGEDTTRQLFYTLLIVLENNIIILDHSSVYFYTFRESVKTYTEPDFYFFVVEDFTKLKLQLKSVLVVANIPPPDH